MAIFQGTPYFGYSDPISTLLEAVCECPPPESKIQKGLIAGRSLKRIHPDTQNIQDRVVVPVCNKTATAAMGPNGQRLFHHLATGGTDLRRIVWGTASNVFPASEALYFRMPRNSPRPASAIDLLSPAFARGSVGNMVPLSILPGFWLSDHVLDFQILMNNQTAGVQQIVCCFAEKVVASALHPVVSCQD
nr:hypothetical protein [Desulfonema ishimotonii]